MRREGPTTIKATHYETTPRGGPLFELSRGPGRSPAHESHRVNTNATHYGSRRVNPNRQPTDNPHASE
ncbi:hypothetical protein Lesp02_43700 [Lentzea sp. NBRC 105346]|nr:hypothetical protein Lesp02_43700 [Lentzea sp. NBRC 105346]